MADESGLYSFDAHLSIRISLPSEKDTPLGKPSQMNLAEMPKIQFFRYKAGQSKTNTTEVKNFVCTDLSRTCEKIKEAFENNFHQEMFLMPDNENHFELVPAMRQLSGIVKVFNENVKNGNVLSLSVLKSMSYLE